MSDKRTKTESSRAKDARQGKAQKRYLLRGKKKQCAKLWLVEVSKNPKSEFFKKYPQYCGPYYHKFKTREIAEQWVAKEKRGRTRDVLYKIIEPKGKG